MNEKQLLEKYGKIWDTKKLREDFRVMGFLAPHIACIRKFDNLKGSMEFQHHPRFYFDFVDEDGMRDEERELKRKIDAGEKVTIGELLGINSKKDVKEWSGKFAERIGL